MGRKRKHLQAVENRILCIQQRPVDVEDNISVIHIGKDKRRGATFQALLKRKRPSQNLKLGSFSSYTFSY
jgi:hypothetical protein